MTLLAEDSPVRGGTMSGTEYRARVIDAFAPQDWQPRLDQATVFQHRDWLTPFYAAVAAHQPGAQPLTAEIRDASGALAFRLPLLLRRDGGLRVIEFADLHMTDFNFPLLGPAAPRFAPQARQAWRALVKALPPHDLLRLAKMPGAVAGAPNPLLLARPGMPAAANGNLLVMGEAWNDFHFGLEKTVRKELERSWRVFTREPETRLEVITGGDEAVALLAVMEKLQRARMAELGQPYEMETPVTAAFYRGLLQSGVPSGFAFLTALKAGEEMVAALLGVRDGETFVMIRLVHAGAHWAKVSPGRLLIHKTLELLHGQGYRRFDFSVGNFAYKRRFGPVRTPLYDLCLARTPRGVPAMLRARAAALLRQHPKAREKLRRLLGKPPSREEV